MDGVYVIFILVEHHLSFFFYFYILEELYLMVHTFIIQILGFQELFFSSSWDNESISCYLWIYKPNACNSERMKRRERWCLTVVLPHVFYLMDFLLGLFIIQFVGFLLQIHSWPRNRFFGNPDFRRLHHLSNA